MEQLLSSFSSSVLMVVQPTTPTWQSTIVGLMQSIIVNVATGFLALGKFQNKMEQLISSLSSSILMVVKPTTPTTPTQPTITGLMESIIADAATMTSMLISRSVRAFPCLAQVPFVEKFSGEVHGHNQSLVALFQNKETHSLYEIMYSTSFKSLTVPATYTAFIVLSLLICRFGLMVYKWATRRTTVISIPSSDTSDFITAEFSITLPSASKSLKDRDDQEKLKRLLYKSIQKVLNGLQSEEAVLIPCRKCTFETSPSVVDDEEQLPVYAPTATTPIDGHRIEVTFPECASDNSQESSDFSDPASDSDDDEEFIYPGNEPDEAASTREATNDAVQSCASYVHQPKPFILDPSANWAPSITALPLSGTTTTTTDESVVVPPSPTPRSEEVVVPALQSSPVAGCGIAEDVPSLIPDTRESAAVIATSETIVAARTPVSDSDKQSTPTMALVDNDEPPVMAAEPADVAPAETLVVAPTPISDSDSPSTPTLALVEDEQPPILATEQAVVAPDKTFVVAPTPISDSDRPSTPTLALLENESEHSPVPATEPAVVAPAETSVVVPTPVSESDSDRPSTPTLALVENDQFPVLATETAVVTPADSETIIAPTPLSNSHRPSAPDWRNAPAVAAPTPVPTSKRQSASNRAPTKSSPAPKTQPKVPPLAPRFRTGGPRFKPNNSNAVTAPPAKAVVAAPPASSSNAPLGASLGGPQCSSDGGLMDSMWAHASSSNAPLEEESHEEPPCSSDDGLKGSRWAH